MTAQQARTGAPSGGDMSDVTSALLSVVVLAGAVGYVAWNLVKGARR